MKKYIWINILLMLTSLNNAQDLRFTIVAENYDYIDCPVRIELTADFYNPLKTYNLFEVQGKVSKSVPFQVELDDQFFLWFIIEGEMSKGESRQYIFKNEEPERKTSDFKIQSNFENMIIYKDESPVLSYQTKEKLPPEGVDPIYRRSAYIHPLWSPGGAVLTSIQPPDHYHHYGIWNPWTKTHIGEREIDYWNLAKGHGTVRFAGLLSREAGAVYAEISTHHEFVDFGNQGADRVTLNEIWDTRVWNIPEKEKRRIIDLTTTLSNAISDTILFDAYRYGGGLGFRSTEKWHKENSTVLTSEGKNRVHADGSRARWCIVEGETSVDEGRSGVLFLSHPLNYEHPEPMRVWPVDANNGRGDLFFEFCPIRHNSWSILPDNTYQLQYRMIVFDGSISKEEAEKYWNCFAYPPSILIKE